MADCALVEGLRSRLGVADTGDAVGSVGAEFQVGIDLPAIDLDALGAITASLGLDAGPLQAAGGDVLARLGDVAGGVDPSGLVAPLLGLVDQVEQLAHADAAAVIARITARVQGGSATAQDQGLAKLQRVLTGVAEVGQDEALQGVVALGRALLPALPDSPLAPLSVWGGGLTTFLSLAGGLLAVESRSRLIEAAPTLAWQRLAPLCEGRLAALAAWGANPLPERVAAHPDDPAVLAAVTAYLRELGEIVHELEDAVGSAELSLAYDDPQRAAAQLAAVEPLLAGTPAGPLTALSQDVAGRLSPLLAQAGPMADGLDLDGRVGHALALVDRLADAVTALDAAAISAPLRSVLAQLTSGISTVADGIGTGVGTVTMALHQIRDAVLAVDLRPLTEAVRSVVQPIADALQRLDDLLADVMGAIGTAMGLAKDAITAVKNGILAAAGTIKDAFDRLAAAIRSLDLAGKVRDLQGGINDVAGELGRIRLEPFFDTSREVMSTAADALRLVPVDILPDDLRQKLAEVSATVRAIDFDAQVRVPLTSQLQGLLTELDTDVLAQVAALHQQLVAFLEGIDPTAPIAELEARFDAELVAPLLALDPDALLAPVSAAITDVQQRIAAIDLRALVVGPIDAAFARILEVIDQANPATALQPLADRLSQARAQVEAATGLANWADTLDQAHTQLLALLDKVDIEALLPRLDASYQMLLDGLRDIPGGGPLGSLIVMLMQKALPASADSWPVVSTWLAEGGAAAQVQARVAAGQARLNDIAVLLQTVDIGAAASRLGAMHSRLAAAVQALPADHPLRLRHGAALVRSPAERLATVAAGLARLLAAAQASSTALAPLVASGFSHTDLARDRLREGLAPLAGLKAQAIGLCRRFGIDPTGRDLGAVLAEILGVLRPSRLLGALQPVITALKAKLDQLVVDGLVAPIKAAILALQDLLARIDLAPVVAELAAVHAAVRGQIAALQPSALIGDVLDAFDTLRDHLASYDPLAPARDAIDAFKAAVAEIAAPGSPVRPTVLFAGIVAAHHEVTGAVAGIDIRNLLKPVLEALNALVVQLDQGLAGSEDAFADLQSALPAA